ncbi:MAG: hypothetical protein QOJ95_450 [Mycobacterium sp.]|nr:hypothetical protein [Mycobacterium sp.]
MATTECGRCVAARTAQKNRYVRHVAPWVARSLVVAAVVTASTGVPGPDSIESPAVRLSADSTALILGGTTVPTPDGHYIDTVKRQYIVPTHPDQDITYVPVTTPEEFWPITGIGRLAASVVGSPSIWGPGGPGWPDEPWWKLAGLFDLTIDQSIQAGVADLEAAMAEHGTNDLVIYGYSQGAVVANLEKRKLAAQYPPGTTAPNIDFVLSGDLNLPNGGLHARFPGLYIPVLDWSFNGAEPSNTQFHTDVITRQYDGLADFPLYPVNVIADLNAVLGVAYVHLNDFDVSLPPDPTTSPAYQGTHGDSSYYFFPTQDLPLFDPLRSLGVPESLINVIEPFFRVIVELGYDRSIPPWQPTPARLIPTLNPAKVAADLVQAIGQGVNNALAIVGTSVSSRTAAPATPNAQPTGVAQPTASPQISDMDRQVSADLIDRSQNQRGTNWAASRMQHGNLGVPMISPTKRAGTETFAPLAAAWSTTDGRTPGLPERNAMRGSVTSPTAGDLRSSRRPGPLVHRSHAIASSHGSDLPDLDSQHPRRGPDEAAHAAQ